MAETTYTIMGHVIDAERRQGMPQLHLEAWDKEHRYGFIVGMASTDAQGAFRFDFADSYFHYLFGDALPTLYFKVFSRQTLLANTETTTCWSAGTPDLPVEITISSADDNSYKVTGYVRESGTQKGIGGVTLQAWDQGHILGSPIISAVTGSDGAFHLDFSDSYLHHYFGNRAPSLYFKALRDGSLVASTDGSVSWTKDRGNMTVEISVPRADQSYTITCHVTETGTGNGVPGIRVEVWDQEHIRNLVIISAVTDANGNLQFDLTDSLLHQYFGDRTPNLYFKAFRENTLVATTDGSIAWKPANGTTIVNISIPPAVDQSYTITCHVIEAGTENAVAGIRVEGWDQEHILGSAVISAVTDADGNLQFNLTDSLLQKAFGDRAPSLCFKAFRDDTLLASSDGSTFWTPDDANMTVEILIPKSTDGAYTIICHVMEAETQSDVPGIRVEAWDQEHILSSAIASATTGANGDLQFTLTDPVLHQYFGDRTPSLYFKAFQEETILASTDGSQCWTPADGNITLDVFVAGSDIEDGGASPPHN